MKHQERLLKYIPADCLFNQCVITSLVTNFDDFKYYYLKVNCLQLDSQFYIVDSTVEEMNEKLDKIFNETANHL